jgi:hypothetical protein
MSWRNPENTIENRLEQQKSPPTKYPAGPIVTNKSHSFISPMNKEFLEYHQQSQDNVKNYLMENRLNTALPPPPPPCLSSMNAGGVLNYPPLKEIPTVRQLFESDVVRKPAGRSKTKAEKDAAEISKFEMDLVKNVTELVISSENDFNKNNKAPMPVMQMPAQNVMEKPPILWFYVDQHGKVR